MFGICVHMICYNSIDALKLANNDDAIQLHVLTIFHSVQSINSLNTSSSFLLSEKKII